MITNVSYQNLLACLMLSYSYNEMTLPVNHEVL